MLMAFIHTSVSAGTQAFTLGAWIFQVSASYGTLKSPMEFPKNKMEGDLELLWEEKGEKDLIFYIW